ncbi:hypothetical protein [Streptomyces sp. NPDC101455]|uniref:hypothetical protein n=1 Tax=Streptomyces sp. NPDC101455 TaxID=3366142 RepID=UPI0037FEC67D
MTLYRNRASGRLTLAVRSEHRMDLRALTLALYHSNEQLGSEVAARGVRAAISDVLASSGSDVITVIADYIHETREYDEGSAVGSDVSERLEWARRLVAKTYRPEFTGRPEGVDALAAFEALPVTEIA